MMQEVESLLKNHGLRKTLGRLQVLDYFRSRPKALSHSELSKAFEGTLDRASLYRMIQDFESHGLIHKVPDDEVSTKYALCHASCSEHAHFDSHAHFKCKSCKETTCLDNAETPSIKLPTGFKAESSELLIHGLCKACA